MTNKYLLILLSVFFFCSCTDELPEDKLPVMSGRTVLAYLISNNGGGNLDIHLKQNLVDMYEGLASAKDTCTLLVYYRPYANDREGLEGPSILKFISNGRGRINNKPVLKGMELNVKNVISSAVTISYEEDNHNATDTRTMQRVFEKMKTLSPSDSYGIIFGSHGTGWMPGKSYRGTKSFGDDRGYSIDIPDMALVLKRVFAKPLDFILFDACMMGTAEVCYELKDVTKYLVGSVVETHVLGYPYDVIMPTLFEDNVRYDMLCNEYIEFSRKQNLWGACAAVDCSKMDELAGWINDNLPSYYAGLEELDITGVQQYGCRRFEYFSFDVLDLFKALNGGIMPEELARILARVVIAKDALYGDNYKVVNELAIEEQHYCGIGMYIPDNKYVNRSDWDDYYKNSISWYKDTGWDILGVSGK